MGLCLYARSQVTCAWHGAKFNIRTGEVLGLSARQGIARYNVRLPATAIEIQVSKGR
jgi:nitrite reductase/ring-hydroxylating ferredoxin subunit